MHTCLVVFVGIIITFSGDATFLVFQLTDNKKMIEVSS